MDLARDTKSFTNEGLAPVPAGAALNERILHDLLKSPDTSRDALVAALQEKTRQFESLLSCVSGTFYRCDLSPPWMMEFISAGIEAISGYGPDAFAAMPFGDLILPDDMAALDEAVSAAVASGEHFAADYRIVHRGGGIRWVHERGAAVYDADGTPLFIEGFISDITEAKALELEAEIAQREAERIDSRMRGVLECTLDGIVSFTPSWDYRFVNASAVEQIGRGDLVGRNLLDVYPEVVETSAWTLMAEAMRHRASRRGECHLPATHTWLDLHAVAEPGGITVFFRNISDRKRLEQTLVGKADDLRRLLDSIPDMIWTAQVDGKGDYYNRATRDFIGQDAMAAGEQESASIAQLIHPDDSDRTMEAWKRSLETGEGFEVEQRMRHHSGEYRWLLVRAWPQRDEGGSIVKWCGASVDIHQRILAEQSLHESQQLQTNILEASADCISIADTDGKLLFLNKPARRLVGMRDDAAFGSHEWTEMWPAKSRGAAREAHRRALSGDIARFTGRGGTDSKPKWADIVVSPIRGTEGEISKLLCISRDVTQERRIADRLRIASEQDVLTKLPNRRAFEKHLKKATAIARETGGTVGLMLIDLDHFKHVNDTLGHLAGDYLLKVISRRLSACVKDSGFVARLGGDEFAIVLTGACDDTDIVAAASRILQKMEASVTFAGKPINGGLSIGSAIYPRDATDAQTLLRHADTALYDLKSSGRGGIQMFNSRTMQAAERSARQLTLARTAIRDDAVEPHYQPKVRLDNGEISGFEALLRWWSPGNGIQPPSQIAEAFNDYELSTKIGGLMQSRIFADMGSWMDRGLVLPSVSINAAPAEFLRDDYAERLLDRLAAASIDPALIEIEITEHVFLERRAEQVARALEKLKLAGVRIALDDFGTGHSSLSHLRDFPVDVLKIDRSFVSGMLTKPRMLAIVQAITKLGPSLSLDIVAEGVESPEQLHALRDTGCEFGQGYLFGKAMNAAEVSRRLTTGTWPFQMRRPPVSGKAPAT